MENKMYLDLEKQKRTLEQNEFTIDASSEEAKAFFTTKQPNQELVVDLENKTTYFEEYQMQEDGTRYSHYLDTKVDDIYVPDTVEIAEDEALVLAKEIKADKLLQLEKLTITTANGNTFDGDNVARQDMLSAIEASATLGVTERAWKLADNTWKVIGLAELKEAQALAIQAKGDILSEAV